MPTPPDYPIDGLPALTLPLVGTDEFIVQRPGGPDLANKLSKQDSGLVTGPGAATNSAVALFDGATGKLLKNGVVLGGAATMNVGAAAGTVAAGDDARFTDARTPTAHAPTHQNGGSDEINVAGLSGVLADPQTPTAHATSHVTGGTDVIPNAVADGNAGLMTGADKTKLDGIEALADVTDAGNVGSSIHGASAKVTPVDADTVPLIDSAASNALKKVTWANVKATLKAYFDPLYQSAITFGTGVLTALGVNVGSAGSIVVNGGALGTPSSGTATNLTGTAAGLTAGTASAVAVGGITGLGTGVATALAVNVGTAGAPVVLNGAGGTPSAIVLTNGTGLPTTGLVNDAVTYAKMQNVSAASKLLGRGDSGSGDPQEISLGSGLTMTGTTLSASGGGGSLGLTVAFSQNSILP